MASYTELRECENRLVSDGYPEKFLGKGRSVYEGLATMFEDRGVPDDQLLSIPPSRRKTVQPKKSGHNRINDNLVESFMNHYTKPERPVKPIAPPKVFQDART